MDIPVTTPHIIRLEEFEKSVEVTTRCPFCKSEYTFNVPRDAFMRWFKGGELIQVAMPDVDVNTRELLVNGWDDC